jgi:hypothetical protein
MTRSEARLDRIENEIQFRRWLQTLRIFETMTVEELEAFAITGIRDDRPEPAFGSSRLDSMDRASLEKLYGKYVAALGGRNSAELEFFAIHGYWPEQRDCP